jgi:hypothetical protein
MTPVSRQTCTGANFKKNFKTCKGMKKVLVAAAIVVGMAFLWVSCKKDDQSTATPSYQEKLDFNSLVHVENGILVFKSNEDFQKLYDILATNENEVTNFEEAFSTEYTSMRKAFSSLANKDFRIDELLAYKEIAYWREEAEEKYVTRIIPNPIYAVLFNENGVVQIGNWILKYTEKDLFIADKKFISMVDNIATAPEVKTINLPVRSGVSERAARECRNVYALKNGKQYRKLEGYTDPEIKIVIDPITGSGTLSATGWFFLWTTNFKRGIFGSWNEYDVDLIGIDLGTRIWEEQNETTASVRNFGCCAAGTIHYVFDGAVAPSRPSCTIQF